MIDGGLMRKDWRRLFPDRELFVKRTKFLVVMQFEIDRVSL